MCHTRDWERDLARDPRYDFDRMLEECWISLDKERLLVDELVDERDTVGIMPNCRCMSDKSLAAAIVRHTGTVASFEPPEYWY